MIDLTTMEKEKRDKIFADSGTKDFPLLFVDGAFVGVCFKQKKKNKNNKSEK